MQIGFFTSCLPRQPLEQVIQWAGANGFEALELMAWPRRNDGREVSLDVEHLDAARAQQWRALAKQNGITYSCLSYNENLLYRDPTRREQSITHLRRVMDAAQLLGVNVVNTFIGRDESRTQGENLNEMERVFAPLLDYAAQRGVRVAIANCPMVGWQFEGLAGNLAYSPQLWDEMFRRLPHPNFGLNIDPSHLAWLGAQRAHDVGVSLEPAL